MLSGDEFLKSTTIQVSSAWVGGAVCRTRNGFRSQEEDSYTSGLEVELCPTGHPARDQRPSVFRKRSVNKMEQISADFHLISSCNRQMAVQFPPRRKTSGCFNSLPSSHSYPAYEMEQISAEFHLISRLSGNHLNCHSYKSH
jgi:hypothetical protein